MSAGDLINAGKKGYKVYKDAKKFFKYCNSVDPEKKWYGELLNTIGGLSSLAGGSIVPGIGIVAGIFSSGIFGGKDSQPVPLKFEGEISLSGEIKKTTPIEGIGFTVPGALVDTDHPNELPYYNKPLGIFSIKSKPVVDVTVKTDVIGTKASGEAGSSDYEISYNVTNIKLTEELLSKISINTIDGYYIDTIEAGFVFSNESAISLESIGSPFNALTTVEELYRLHEHTDVEFFNVDSSTLGDFNYNEKAICDVCVQGYMYYKYTDTRWWYQEVRWAGVPSDMIDQNIKTIASVVAPEIAIKVTMYANSDTEKENPIIHLKRVRADYNLYWNHIIGVPTIISTDPYTGWPVTTYVPTEVTDHLGLFTN